MRKTSCVCLCFSIAVVGLMSLGTQALPAEEIQLQLRYQAETQLDSNKYHRLERSETWDPSRTAIIVCDMWDSHHCLNAVRRVNQIAPRLNEVLASARGRGVTIIHAPSDCMDAYQDHPARRRAEQTPTAKNQPPSIASWCSAIPSEEAAAYPIDQTDGGEDDDPIEHAQWVAQLKRMGRNPGTPWKTQHPALAIDDKRDYISDRGDEVWNILEARKIRHVILAGVHTNMCVVGRPFGLRQMARTGKQVVLMRDMTDTMYNPASWPYVSHFTGTDRIIDHVERFICPTITSDQLIGGTPLRFQRDKRPHVVILMAEKLYDTADSLTQFAYNYLGQNFQVTLVYNDANDPNRLPGIASVSDADVVIVSVRRRALPSHQLKLLKDHAAAGKPIIGIRTASHAFSVRGRLDSNSDAEEWNEFDAEVLGGNYHGHHANELQSKISHAAASEILTGVDPAFPQIGSLYKNAPLQAGATALLNGDAEGVSTEPVAWTFTRANGGRSFYTSLGHPEEFKNPNFIRLLYNAIHWCTDLPISSPASPSPSAWQTVQVPNTESNGQWYRSVVHLPSAWQPKLKLVCDTETTIEAWLNGQPLQPIKTVEGQAQALRVVSDSIYADDANLLVIRLDEAKPFSSAPVFVSGAGERLELSGRWQASQLDKASFSNLPLPAKFAAASNIIFTSDEPMGVARPVTHPGRFTPGIEGPACDSDGNIYAVNFERQGTIGRIRPDGHGEVFVELPEGSIGNGIRFDAKGNFYVADYTGHNILHVDVKSRKVTTFAHNPKMNQPNDLAIAPNGTLYASDPNWGESTGQVWRIDLDGSTHLVAPQMGTTNGIEVSPDGKTLYVNESVQRNIWAFDIEQDGSLTGKRLLKKFDDFGFDGMRCDVDGNLYLTRYGKGTVVKLSATGDVLNEYNVLGAKPSNLCFGGPERRTIYVTEVEATRLVKFRVERPGRP